MAREDGRGQGGFYRTPTPTELFSPDQITLATAGKKALLSKKLPNKYMRLQGEYPKVFKDPQQVDREKLLGPAIKIMEAMAHEYGASFPPDLLPRLVIADLDTLVDTLLVFQSPEIVRQELRSQTLPTGFVLPGNVGVVNEWRITNGYDLDNKGEREKRNDYMREESIHQLWRLAAWKEGTADAVASLGNFVFRAPRDGIFVQNDDNKDISRGMFILDEDVQNYLTRRTLEEGGYRMRRSYALTTPTTDMLVRHVGEEPLVRAFLTDDGLHYLEGSLERSPTIGGENVLWRVAQKLGAGS